MRYASGRLAKCRCKKTLCGVFTLMPIKQLRFTSSLMKHVLILCFALLATGLTAQRSVYDSLVVLAGQSFEAKDYGTAGTRYLAAVKALEYKAFNDDRFQAAQALALSNRPDSAFSYLFRLLTKTEYLSLSLLKDQPNFEPLRGDPRWQELLSALTPSMPELAAELEAIHRLDQEGRKKLPPISEKYGYHSEEYKALWKTINHQDSINRLRILEILDQYGWLGKKEVGSRGNATLFLVIQHSDLKTQEKYLPMMREAAQQGKALKTDLAMLEDRTRLGQGKKQLYATQMAINYDTGERTYRPIEDVENLNKRRESMGLMPFSADRIEMLKQEN